MTYRDLAIGQIAKLQRRRVEVEPLQMYREIGIRSFGRGVFHKEPGQGIELGNKRVFEVWPGDLLLNNVFAWEGAVAVASVAEEGMIGSHRFMTYVVDPEMADVRYVRYFLTSERGLKLLGKASPGSAGRNRTLNIGAFEALSIRLPDVIEQQRIAAKLEVVLGSISELEQRIESIGPSEMNRLLPDVIEAESRRASAEFTPLEQLVNFVSDVVRPGEPLGEARDFVGLQHVEPHTGRMLGSLPTGNEEGPKHRFSRNDITYPRLRPYQNKVWLADRPGLCSVDQYVLRPRAGVDGRMLALSMRSTSVLAAVVNATSSLQHPRIRKGDLARTLVPMVPSEASQGFVARMEKAESQLRRAVALRSRTTPQVRALRSSVLEHSFNGQL